MSYNALPLDFPFAPTRALRQRAHRHNRVRHAEFLVISAKMNSAQTAWPAWRARRKQEVRIRDG
ncbi:MAG: hypothetical protein JW953_17105 [Anaerolineae bacterium]|nr:hypothetical protein [Anaerolineae bacterium]